MGDRNLLEAQFHWAFACLVLAGQRGPEDFHAELMRRSSGVYPDASEVEETIEEALCYLPAVLNQALAKKRKERPLTGWERHALALAGNPRQAALEQREKPFLLRKKSSF